MKHKLKKQTQEGTFKEDENLLEISNIIVGIIISTE